MHLHDTLLQARRERLIGLYGDDGADQITDAAGSMLNEGLEEWVAWRQAESDYLSTLRTTP